MGARGKRELITGEFDRWTEVGGDGDAGARAGRQASPGAQTPPHLVGSCGRETVIWESRRGSSQSLE